ncbi:MAG: hypothetical protein R3A45_01860 [Bdellovibrionota bacterium]
MKFSITTFCGFFDKDETYEGPSVDEMLATTIEIILERAIKGGEGLHGVFKAAGSKVVGKNLHVSKKKSINLSIILAMKVNEIFAMNIKKLAKEFNKLTLYSSIGVYPKQIMTKRTVGEKVLQLLTFTNEYWARKVWEVILEVIG